MSPYAAAARSGFTRQSSQMERCPAGFLVIAICVRDLRILLGICIFFGAIYLDAQFLPVKFNGPT
jgi:hypothetical protein